MWLARRADCGKISQHPPELTAETFLLDCLQVRNATHRQLHKTLDQEKYGAIPTMGLFMGIAYYVSGRDRGIF